ncbi:MAG TPA: hypothetical protein VJ861_13325 [Treponemataceae bacterium]|nr:hypothetical protein [Treponemataceae bacterium]
MLGKTSRSNVYWKLLLLVGIISLIVSLILYKMVSIERPHISMLKGMFIGLGSVFTAIGIINIFQIKMSSPEKLKANEIELKDERNIEILMLALSISGKVATYLFAIMSFVFIGMNYIVPALMAIGSMYIQLSVFLIAHRYYKSKM